MVSFYVNLLSILLLHESTYSFYFDMAGDTHLLCLQTGVVNIALYHRRLFYIREKYRHVLNKNVDEKNLNVMLVQDFSVKLIGPQYGWNICVINQLYHCRTNIKGVRFRCMLKKTRRLE